MRLALEQTIGRGTVPKEYNEFCFCRDMGYTYDQLLDLPVDVYTQWRMFMKAESDARELISRMS